MYPRLKIRLPVSGLYNVDQFWIGVGGKEWQIRYQISATSCFLLFAIMSRSPHTLQLSENFNRTKTPRRLSLGIVYHPETGEYGNIKVMVYFKLHILLILMLSSPVMIDPINSNSESFLPGPDSS